MCVLKIPEQQHTRTFNITMPGEVFAMLEKQRGRIPRSRFVADILKEALRKQEGEKKK